MTKLKEVRMRKGWTQKELADSTGISLRMIQHYEQGDFDFKNVGVLTMLKFANALGVSLAEILVGEAQDEAVKYDRYTLSAIDE
jgi:transcriptional regulator with XRE-family HTH domain